MRLGSAAWPGDAQETMVKPTINIAHRDSIAKLAQSPIQSEAGADCAHTGKTQDFRVIRKGLLKQCLPSSESYDRMSVAMDHFSTANAAAVSASGTATVRDN